MQSALSLEGYEDRAMGPRKSRGAIGEGQLRQKGHRDSHQPDGKKRPGGMNRPTSWSSPPQSPATSSSCVNATRSQRAGKPTKATCNVLPEGQGLARGSRQCTWKGKQSKANTASSSIGPYSLAPSLPDYSTRSTDRKKREPRHGV